jgi:hypothetical protein
VPSTFLSRKIRKTAMPASTKSWIMGEFMKVSSSQA